MSNSINPATWARMTLVQFAMAGSVLLGGGYTVGTIRAQIDRQEDAAASQQAASAAERAAIADRVRQNELTLQRVTSVLELLSQQRQQDRQEQRDRDRDARRTSRSE